MKNLLVIFMCLFAINCYSQNKVGIYYVEQDVKLPTSRVIGKKVGNIAGAYFTLGLSAASNNKVIEGKGSDLTIENNIPSFKFITGDDIITGYIFTKASNIDNIVLLKLHQKGKSRQLRTGKYGLTSGVQTGLNEDDMIPLNIEKADNSSVIIKPKGKLKKGEYCFYYIGEIPEGVSEFNSVFDFSIK